MSEQASQLAWKYANADGLLLPGLCPRCNVFVDGKLIDKCAKADLNAGYVEALRSDWIGPNDEEVPRQRIEGFIDIQLIGAQA
jgi:hypothetical protein